MPPPGPDAPLALRKSAVSEEWVRECVEAKHRETEALILEQQKAWKKWLAEAKHQLRSAAEQDLGSLAPVAKKLPELEDQLATVESEVSQLRVNSRQSAGLPASDVEDRLLKLERHLGRSTDRLEILEARCNELDAGVGGRAGAGASEARLLKLEGLWDQSNERLEALETRCTELDAMQRSISSVGPSASEAALPRDAELHRAWREQTNGSTEGTTRGIEPPLVMEVDQTTDGKPQSVVPKSEKTKALGESDEDHFILEWQPRASIWDGALLAGIKLHGDHHHMTYAVILWLVIFLNVFIQVVFLVIVSRSSFAGKTIDISAGDLDRLQAWRRNVGHDASHLDPVERSSLTSRVCQEDFVTEMAGSQVSLLIDIRNYIGETGIERLFGGTMMASLALLLWSMSVCKEALDTLHAILSLMALPRGRATLLEENNDDRVVELKAISRWRLTMVVFVQCVRFVIAMVLFYFGSVFLKNIVSVQDLLLNAVALGFVLSVDELCFDALVPTLVTTTIERIKPIERKVSTRRLLGPDFFRRFVIVVVSIVLIYNVGWELPALRDDLTKARDALCEGRQDFVYTVNAAGFVNWLPTSPSGELQDSDRSSYTRAAVQELIDFTNYSEDAEPPLTSAEATTLRDVRYSMDDWDTRSAAEVLNYVNPSCKDILDFDVESPYKFMAKEMLRATFSKPIENCSDVADQCDREGEQATRARQFCPVTCGCDDPGSTLIFNKPVHGCPIGCKSTRQYESKRHRMSCTSPNGTELRDNAAWQVLLESGPKVMRNWTGGARIQYQGFFFRMRINGCDFVHWMGNQGWDVCSSLTDAWAFRSVSLICPEQCNCQGRPDLIDCPGRC